MPDNSDYTILSGREIKLLNSKDSNYPQLSSLCLDFEFTVMEMLISESGSSKLWGKKYTLFENTSRSITLTPHFDDLASLEDYCRKNLVSLLNQYLETDAETETKPNLNIVG